MLACFHYGRHRADLSQTGSWTFSVELAFTLALTPALSPKRGNHHWLILVLRMPARQSSRWFFKETANDSPSPGGEIWGESGRPACRDNSDAEARMRPAAGICLLRRGIHAYLRRSFCCWNP